MQIEDENGEREKKKKAQCFHYAVLSAVRRETPLIGVGHQVSAPEGRIPHPAFIL